MAGEKRYYHVTQFQGGINNWADPKDIGNDQMSEGQNVSVDKIGRIRTMGGLVSHSEVPTQGAVVCPGSGLKVYSSDHWLESSPTITDLLPTNHAASDQGTEADATTGWALISANTQALSSGDPVGDFSIEDTPVSGSDYVMRCVLNSDNGAGVKLSSPATTVIGERYTASVYMFTPSADPIVTRLIVRETDAGTVIAAFITAPTTDTWELLQADFVATTTASFFEVQYGQTSTGGAFYWDNTCLALSADPGIRGDWLALADPVNAQVDLYSDNADSFRDGDDSDGFLDFGTVSTYVATADKINFPTTSTITDSNSKFLNKGMQRGQIWKISNADLGANDILIVLERVTAGTLFIRGTPLTLDVDNDSAVTFTKYNPTAFHFVNEALRASPIGGGRFIRPKQYGFAERTHFSDAPLGSDDYKDWFLNDIGPASPTDQYIETVDTDGDRDITSDVDAGEGFEIAVTDNAGDGEWTAATWEVATSFIYDDGQESALYVPPTAQTFTTTEASSQDIAVRAHNTGTSYNERISGGRAYCRKNLSDDPWALLVDIDMKQGARATLSGSYNAWAEGSTTFVVYSDGFDTFRLNPDTYEGLTGLDPASVRETFVGDNTCWDTSVIAGNRCFLASARYTGKGAEEPSYFRDRILYSQVNQYDIFPIDNFIDVIRGDADDYVKLVHYNDRILAFKQRNLFVINISDSSPKNWFLEETHYFRGILHPGAVFMTPYGVAWSNEIGAYLYDGSQITNLIDFKIDRDTWAAFHTDYSIDGYHKKTDTLVVMGDCTLDGSGDGYFFDFTTQAWTYGSGIFNSSRIYTNFETDWNQDLIIGEENSGTVTIKVWNDTPASQAQSKIVYRGKDINFGSEFAKIVDKIIVTYKSPGAAQASAVKYAVNGSTSFNAFSPVGSFASNSNWTRLVVSPTTPITCYSMRLEITNAQNAGTIELNDIAIRYQEVPLLLE